MDEIAGIGIAAVMGRARKIGRRTKHVVIRSSGRIASRASNRWNRARNLSPNRKPRTSPKTHHRARQRELSRSHHNPARKQAHVRMHRQVKVSSVVNAANAEAVVAVAGVAAAVVAVVKKDLQAHRYMEIGRASCRERV